MSRGEKLIDGYTRFLQQRAIPVIILVVLLAAFSVAGLFRLHIQTDFSVFMPSGSERVRAMQRISESFGDGEQLIIIAESGTGTEELKALPLLTERLAAIPGISSVEGSIPSSVAGMSDDEIQGLMDRVEHMTGSPPLLKAEGTTWALFRLATLAGKNKRGIIHNVRSVLDGEGRRYYLSGEPYLEATVFDYILQIILTLPPAALVLIIFIFRLRIGSLRATALSMVPAAFGALLTLGLVAWLKGTVSVITVLVPVYVLVLGSADGLHVTSHVLDAIENGSSLFEAVRDTLDAVGGAIIMTTITTMAGFLSLLLIKSPAIREMALIASGGILIAGGATWLLVPVLLLKIGPLHRKHRRAEAGIQRALAALVGKPSIIITAILLIAFLPGLFLLEANFSMIDVYKPSTEVRKNIDAVTRITGGSIPVYLLFPADEPFDPETAGAVLSFDERVRKKGIVGSGMSPYSIIASVSESLTGRSGYPANALFAERAAVLVSKLQPSFMPVFFSENGLGRAVFFLRDLDDGTIKAFNETAAEVSRDTGINLEGAGTAFVMQEMNDQILPQQLFSMMLAAAVVFVLIAASQKSLRLGFLSTLPIMITLIILFGIMGYADIDVSIITSIMSGLTIGVGIDYAIHYIAMYRRAEKRESEKPCMEALSFVATPVTANAAGLAVGFSALALSPLSIHATLSVLMWVTMTASSFLSLTLLPTLTRKRRNPRQSS